MPMSWKGWRAIETDGQSLGGDGIWASSAILSNTRKLAEKVRFLLPILDASKRGV